MQQQTQLRGCCNARQHDQPAAWIAWHCQQGQQQLDHALQGLKVLYYAAGIHTLVLHSCAQEPVSGQLIHLQLFVEHDFDSAACCLHAKLSAGSLRVCASGIESACCIPELLQRQCA